MWCGSGLQSTRHAAASSIVTRIDSDAGLTRREFGALVTGTLIAAAVPADGLAQDRATAVSASPGPVLDIADWSYFWFGVERAMLARGTVVNGAQMFVEHWIPSQVRHPYPV